MDAEVVNLFASTFTGNVNVVAPSATLILVTVIKLFIPPLKLDKLTVVPAP